MFMPAWKLMTLPRVRIDISRWFAESLTFRNLDTNVLVDGASPNLRHGQVMWGTSTVDSLAGIAWDWREVQPNVVAMCDPMAVQSNIELVDDNDQVVSEAKQLLYLNRVIHGLAWQEHVCAIWRSKPVLRRAA